MDTRRPVAYRAEDQEEETKMIITPQAWASEGIVQLPAIPAHVELTPGQARAFARSLESAADRAETHTVLLARLAAKVTRFDEDWPTAHSEALGGGVEG